MCVWDKKTLRIGEADSSAYAERIRANKARIAKRASCVLPYAAKRASLFDKRDLDVTVALVAGFVRGTARVRESSVSWGCGGAGEVIGA